jgi:hypothetical protein
VTADLLRALERAHGALAWVGTAGLVVAGALPRFTNTMSRRARVTWLAIATGLLVAATALGFVLHDPFRFRLRQRLFIASPALGWLFERKQHAAFASVLLSVCALAALARRERIGPGSEADALRGAASAAWVASVVLALAASIASVVVARRAHF